MSGSGLETGGPGLLRGLIDGDAAAHAWLARRVREQAAPRFSPWAWRWIAEDFQSELVLRLTTTVTRSGFTVGSSARAYLDASISNLCTKYFRRVARMRRSDSVADAAPVLEDRNAISVERIAAALDLRRALMALSSKCRSLLVSKYVMGSSLDEMAKREAIEPKTVQSRLHDCRERLRRLLNDRSAGRPNASADRDSVSSRGKERGEALGATSSQERGIGETLVLNAMGLLEGRDLELLERRLADDAALRDGLDELRRLAAAWSADDDAHPTEEDLASAPARVFEHILACADCRFEAAILAEARAAQPLPATGPPAWMGLAAAAVVAATLAGLSGFWIGGRQPRPSTSLTLDLGAVRGTGEAPTVRLSELVADGVTLSVEARLPAGTARFRIVGENGTVLGAGPIEVGDGGPGMKTIGIFVPRSDLRSGAWVLELTAPDGASAQWQFRIRP